MADEPVVATNPQPVKAGSGEYEELDLLRRKLDTTESEITKIEKELAELLRQHDHNRELLNSIFSGIVRSVLSSGNYDGEVGLDNRWFTPFTAYWP